MNIILIIVGFFLLIKSADLFVEGSSKFASSIGISTFIIGLTIVAFGTSAPETAVSVVASIHNQNEITLGNVIGSNICNLLLVIGVSGLFCNLKIRKKMLYRDYLYSIFSYVLLFIMCILNDKLNYKNGIIFLIFLFIYLSLLFFDAHDDKNKGENERLKLEYIFYIIVGLIGIILGGKIVVESTSNLAIRLGVSDRVVALSIVALGTSLPELVTSIVASKKGEVNMAIGNVIGSNIFNILSILGISLCISPLKLSFISCVDISILCIAGLIVFILMIRKKEIGRVESLILLILYFAYIFYIINR